MSQLPEGLKFTSEHEWVKFEGSLARVGITDFAQHELGDIVFVEIPEVGTMLMAGESFGTVESVKTVSDLYAPMSGRVVEVNQALVDQPELVNSAPYTEGWMVVVEVSAPEEALHLLDATEYQKHIGE